MITEFETKVLNINPKKIIKNLRFLGAKEIPESLIRRYVFDNDPQGPIEFFRLREYQGRSFLTYKRKLKGNSKVGNTSEINVEVSDFDSCAQIFLRLGFTRVFYQENKRHLFVLDGIEFCIDTWPLLAPYLEIEAKNKKKLQMGLKILDLIGKDVGDKDIKIIYKECGIDLHAYKDLKF